MDYEIIKTEKGKDAILKDGHIFERNSEDTNGKNIGDAAITTQQNVMHVFIH